jgi:hypothetical protein
MFIFNVKIWENIYLKYCSFKVYVFLFSPTKTETFFRTKKTKKGVLSLI